LVSLDGTPAVEGTAVTLAFGDDNTVSGYAGCNNYSGGYEADNTSLTFSMLISTLRACIDDALNQQETAFLAALQSASAYTLAEGQLVITYEDGKTLVFAEAKGLAGSSWQLVSLDGTPAVEGTAVTLAFGDDNTVSGYAGCNNYSGGYEADNTSLTFSMLISTLRACIDDALNQQETAFLAALNGTVSYTISSAELVITSSDGKELRFTPLDPAAAGS
jgi:heat shock protein HslJ